VRHTERRRRRPVSECAVTLDAPPKILPPLLLLKPHMPNLPSSPREQSVRLFLRKAFALARSPVNPSSLPLYFSLFRSLTHMRTTLLPFPTLPLPSFSAVTSLSPSTVPSSHIQPIRSFSLARALSLSLSVFLSLALLFATPDAYPAPLQPTFADHQPPLFLLSTCRLLLSSETCRSPSQTPCFLFHVQSDHSSKFFEYFQSMCVNYFLKTEHVISSLQNALSNSVAAINFNLCKNLLSFDCNFMIALNFVNV